MWKLALAIYEYRQKRSAPARPLYEEQPMADGQGIQFHPFYFRIGKVSAAKSRW